MKEVRIAVRVDDETGKIATVFKSNGFKDNSIEKILMVVGILENLKQVQLKSLENLRKEYG